MTDINAADRIVLEPYAEALAEILNKIETLDNAELAAITIACDAPTSTNCWWAIKCAADFLKPFLAAEYGRRTTLEMKRANEVLSKL